MGRRYYGLLNPDMSQFPEGVDSHGLIVFDTCILGWDKWERQFNRTREDMQTKKPFVGLLREDVVLAIDGKNVATQGIIHHGAAGRVHWTAIINKFLVGETLKLTVWRDKQVVDVLQPLARNQAKVQLRTVRDIPPRYLIYGGLVFQPIFLRDGTAHPHGFSLARSMEKIFVHRRFGFREHEDEEVITIANVLERGRYGMPLIRNRVEQVNGRKVRNLRHLAQLLDDESSKFVRIDFSPQPRSIVLDVKKEKVKTKKLLEDLEIPQDRNLENGSWNSV
eukprot:GHVU01181971.1.p1 GENE.GHVU01181971.1~~GHVU01181971.1.p1  ORF type:complete len:278 (+),score=32.63 GHVU01181971.1:447-1280(+)